MDNYKMVKENATEVLHINDRLEKAQEKVKSFNEREVLFK
jgi:dynein heavy chain